MKKKSLIQTLTGSREMSLVAVLIVLLVIIEIMSPSFLSPNNLSQIFRNNALTMLMALGMLCEYTALHIFIVEDVSKPHFLLARSLF